MSAAVIGQFHSLETYLVSPIDYSIKRDHSQLKLQIMAGSGSWGTPRWVTCVAVIGHFHSL